jgi:hypothetical protein
LTGSNRAGVFADAAAEILLLGLAAHLGERQHAGRMLAGRRGMDVEFGCTRAVSAYPLTARRSRLVLSADRGSLVEAIRSIAVTSRARREVAMPLRCLNPTIQTYSPMTRDGHAFACYSL